ncbi:MAG: O-antigen ligase family protein [Candidatus Tectomicrobia bacterium]|nr:O-antigen ligase family protein [Candidatus Tectomicrobia bacterium]
MGKLAHAMAQGLLALLLVGPFFVFSWLNTTLFLFPKTIFAVLTGTLLVTVAALRWLTGARRLRLPGGTAGIAMLAFVGLFLWSLLTLPGAHFPHQAVEHSLLLGGMGLLYLALRPLLRTPTWRAIHSGLVVAAASLTAIYAIVQFYGLDPIFCQQAGDLTYTCVQSASSGKIVAGGFLGNPNFVGMALVPAFFLALAAFSRFYGAERTWPALGFALAALCLLFGLRASESRIGGVALVVGLVAVVLQILALLLRRLRLLRLLILAQAGGIVALIGLSLWLSLAPLAPTMIAKLENLSSGRLFAWRIAGRMIAANPITGIGLGGYPSEYFRARAELLKEPEEEVYNLNLYPRNLQQKPHNDYLQIAGELGLPGLLLMVVLLVALTTLAAHQLSVGLRQLGIGEAAGRLLNFQAWMSLMIAGVAHYPFQFPTLAILTLFTTALVTTGATTTNTSEAGQTLPSSGNLRDAMPGALWLRRGMQAVLCLLAAVFLFATVTVFRADVAVERGRRLLLSYRQQLHAVGDDLGAVDRAALLQARERFNASLRLYPWSGRAWYFLGNTHLLERAPDKAMASFLRGLLDERTESLHYAVAVAAHGRGYLARALREYARLLEFAPHAARYGQMLTTVLAVPERLL